VPSAQSGRVRSAEAAEHVLLHAEIFEDRFHDGFRVG
jgi:hypothetical protein